jgi:cytochrome c-type biogenesis protein CcmH
MARLVFFTLLLMLSAGGPVLAVRPGEQLPDPAQEARARHLSSELRCLVCQNQSIDDSDASLAVDLRRIVRERIAAGDSDQVIRDFLVARYGDFVLLKPPLSGKTILLWGLPGIALLLGAFAAFSLFRRPRREEDVTSDQPAVEAALSEAERRELDEIISGKTRS